MTTFSLRAPNPGQVFITSSGTSYTSDIYNVIAGVPAGNDLKDLVASGCEFLPAGAGSGRNNLAATGAPGSTDDSSKDYAVGSMWIDTVGNAAYFCISAAASAAVWTGYPSSTTVSAGGDATAGHLDVYPATTSSGKWRRNAADNAGAYTITETNASFGQATAITLPDPASATAAYVLDKATQTLTNKTLTGNINADTKLCGTQLDATTNTTLANIVGMVQTVVAGTYDIEIHLSGTAGASGGLKAAFKLTTTVITSWDMVSYGNADGVAPVIKHVTTTTDQTSLVASTSALTATIIKGSAVIGTGGTMQLQAAQNASNGTTTSIYVGSKMKFTRIA